MILHATDLPGVMLVELELREDERGWFTRTYCRREFAQAGIDFRIEQCNSSFNPRKGTVRGLHYQRDPFAEAKLVGCERGAIHDVVLDLRPASATYRRSFATEISQNRPLALYVPAGVAHGFQSLADDTLVTYQMSACYEPSAATGVRWDDPAFGIRWPLPVTRISEKDRSYADYSAEGQA